MIINNDPLAEAEYWRRLMNPIRKTWRCLECGEAGHDASVNPKCSTTMLRCKNGHTGSTLGPEGFEIVYNFTTTR